MNRPYKPLGLDHVVLRVKDQAESQRFYCDVLGATLEHVNQKLSLVHLRFGDVLIDLLPRAGTDGESTNRAVFDHYCLSIDCDDLKAVAQWIKDKGQQIEGEIVDRRGAHGTSLSFYIRDPDGYRVELKPRGHAPGH